MAGQINDKKNITGGSAQILVAATGTAKPTSFRDIFGTEDGTTPVSSWRNVGATDGGVSISRGYDKTEWEVDQVLGVIDEFITKWNMSVDTNVAETDLENYKLAWGLGVATSVAITTSLTGSDIAFSNANTITSTGTDLSVFNAGEKFAVTGSVSNNSVFTVVGTPTTTSITVVETTATEVAGASVTLDATLQNIVEESLGLNTNEVVAEKMMAVIVDKRTVSGKAYRKAYLFYRAKYDGSDSTTAFNKAEKTLLPTKFILLPDTTEATNDTRFGKIIDQKY